MRQLSKLLAPTNRSPENNDHWSQLADKTKIRKPRKQRKDATNWFYVIKHNAQLTCEQRIHWTWTLRRKHLTQLEVRAPSVANHCWIVCYVLPQVTDLIEKELLFLTSFLKQTTRLKPTWPTKATNLKRVIPLPCPMRQPDKAPTSALFSNQSAKQYRIAEATAKLKC